MATTTGIVAALLAVSAPTSGQLGGLTTSNLSASAGIVSGQIASVSGSTITGANSVPDSVLSTNVPLKNAANVFTAVQTFTGLVEAISTKTANYTLTGADSIIIANAATTTQTLPSAVTAGAGRLYTIKNGPSGTSTTVGATAGTIDGAATDTTLSTAFAAGRYVSDGTNWFKI